MLQRLAYSRFAMANVDLDKLDAIALEPYPTCPESKFLWDPVQRGSLPGLRPVEDWFKGTTSEWTYWVDALFYVFSGKG